jgi:hypothetical protein
MALDDLYGKILALGMQVVRQQTSLPALVNHQTEGERANEMRRGGQTEVIVPPEFATRDVVPASTPPASGASPAPNTVPVPLNYWKEVNFPLSTKQVALMENADRDVPMFLRNAVGPIVEDMTASIAAQYKGIYGYVGTAGTTPFASTPTEAQQAKTTLTRQPCPRWMRQMVVNTDAYANAIALPQFSEVYKFGSDEAIREGEVRRAIGFDWWEDVGLDGLQHTTTASLDDWLVNQADHAAGDTTVTVDSGATPAGVGDIFTVAGDSQTYVVTASTPTTITYQPAAKVNWADNAQITFKASHALNFAFNPFAWAFDSRPAVRLSLPGVTSNFMTWVDDETGVVLRLEIRDEYHQTGFYLSCLWGAVLVDPRLACRVAG